MSTTAGPAAADSSAGSVTAAVDVGGTSVKAALVHADGSVGGELRRPTGRERGPAAAVAAVLDTVAELVAVARESGQEPAAVGLALPGLVDEGAGVAVRSATIGWQDVPFARLAAERTGLPTVLAHDVRAGGVAEARVGAGAGERRFLFVPVGTSIAAAVLADGRAETGAHHAAGEIGHLPVRHRADPASPFRPSTDGARCACGAWGCAENTASAAAVAARYSAVAGRSVTAAEVSRLAAAGDPAAAAVWDDAVQALADALAACVAVLDPPLIVLGGGLAESGELLLAPLRAALAARVTLHDSPRLTRARLGDRAGCIGAGLTAHDALTPQGREPHLRPSDGNGPTAPGTQPRTSRTAQFPAPLRGTAN